jgi:transglutaminase-like putative cysteine protease
VALLLINSIANGQICGIMVHAQAPHTLHLCLDGVWQNDQPMQHIKACCLTIDFVQAQILVDSESIIKTPLNLKNGYFSHYSVGSEGLVFEGYEEIPAHYETMERVMVVNKQHDSTKTTPTVQTPTTLSESDFVDVYAYINGLAYDFEQLRAAKVALKRTRMSTQQIKRLLNAFSHEATKIEFALFAYDYVTDPIYYSKILEAFKNPVDKETIENFLQKHR